MRTHTHTHIYTRIHAPQINSRHLQKYELTTEGAVETIRDDEGGGDVAGTAETIREGDDDDAECEFEELELAAASERVLESLGDDEEVFVLMPADEFVLPQGPKRTVLYWLCRDMVMTEKINGYLEGKPRLP